MGIEKSRTEKERSISSFLPLNRLAPCRMKIAISRHPKRFLLISSFLNITPPSHFPQFQDIMRVLGFSNLAGKNQEIR